MADPDLQVGERMGPGHPDPEISRGAVSKKNFFRPFAPQFGLKIRGGGPGLSPRSATACWPVSR